MIGLGISSLLMASDFQTMFWWRFVVCFIGWEMSNDGCSFVHNDMGEEVLTTRTHVSVEITLNKYHFVSLALLAVHQMASYF